MPEIANENNDTITRQKRLIYRSWHRGTREIDLILGRFAQAHVPNFDDRQLDLYERILLNSDPDLYNWVAGVEPVPFSEQNEIMDLLTAFSVVTGQA